MSTATDDGGAAGAGPDDDGLGTYVLYFDKEGGSTRVRAESLAEIDEAMDRFLASGGARDEVLHLETIEGAPMRVLVSDIRSWTLSSPGARHAARGFEEASRRANAAPPWEDHE